MKKKELKNNNNVIYSISTCLFAFYNYFFKEENLDHNNCPRNNLELDNINKAKYTTKKKQNTHHSFFHHFLQFRACHFGLLRRKMRRK